MRNKCIFIFLGLVLSACLPAPVSTAVPATVTAAPIESPTPTIDWFPVTETSEPMATVEIVASPTPELITGIGDLLLEEKFDDAEKWQTYPYIFEGVQLTNNHMTMILSGAKEYSYASLKDLDIYTFYGEITIKPNLCMSEDEYGIIFRSDELNDYFRLGITCGGVARVNRMTDGIFYTMVYDFAVERQPTGPPATVKISIWAMGTEIRFFINDQFLFTVTDPVGRGGSFGTFIHSAGESTLSVNFSELKFWDIN